MDLVDALAATDGICSVVGAGGKKSTLYCLAERLDRSIVTATVRIPPFDAAVKSLVVTDSPKEVIATNETWPLGLVASRSGADRLEGYEPSTVTAFASEFDGTVLVKADGARMRQFKAPAEHEPRIPTSTTTVLPVVSAHVVGMPLTEERVHRVDEVTAIAGIERGDKITPAVVATVLASEEGGHKGVPGGATVVPVINMVDDAHLEATGRDIAAEVHERVSVPHVVLASMRESDPLVACI